MTALAITVVAFGLLLLGVRAGWSPLRAIDGGALAHLHEFALQHNTFTAIMKAVSIAGSAPVYVALFTVITAWLLYRRRLRLAVFVAVTEGGGALLNSLVKNAVHRDRPIVAGPLVHASGFSFPSGHAQSSAVSCSLLLVMFWNAMDHVWRRITTTATIVVIFGIGLSRFALSVHYVSDVMSGYGLGAAWVIAMTALFGIWNRERSSATMHEAQSSPRGAIVASARHGEGKSVAGDSEAGRGAGEETSTPRRRTVISGPSGSSVRCADASWP